MELPQGYQKRFQTDPAEKKNRAGTPRNDWEEALGLFGAKLNPDRKRAGYEPYSHARIAKLLNNAGVHDARTAYIFYRHIETTSRNFGKLFQYLTNKGSSPKAH